MSDSDRPMPAAGWYRDPTRQGDARYWNGGAWTNAVSREGVTISVVMAPELRTTPPVPGTEFVAPAATPSPSVVYVSAPAQQASAAPRRSPFGPLVGALLLAAAVVAIVVVLVNATGGDDDPAEPTAPPATEQPDGGGGEAPAGGADATTPPEGSG